MYTCQSVPHSRRTQVEEGSELLRKVRQGRAGDATSAESLEGGQTPSGGGSGGARYLGQKHNLPRSEASAAKHAGHGAG